MLSRKLWHCNKKVYLIITANFLVFVNLIREKTVYILLFLITKQLKETFNVQHKLNVVYIVRLHW